MRQGVVWISVVFALLLCSCNYNSFEDIKGEAIGEPWVVNSLISHLRPSLAPIEGSTIVSGVVVSSDSAGNFYKEIILHDPSSGEQPSLRLSVGLYDIYSLMSIGDIIAVELQGLSLVVSEDGILSAGYLDSNSQGISPIPTLPILNQITNNQGVSVPLEWRDSALGELQGVAAGSLVRVYDLYFFEQSGIYSGERELRQLNSGHSATLNTSSFALFANDPVIEGLFDIEAIVIESGGEKQLKINSLQDINLTQ